MICRRCGAEIDSKPMIEKKSSKRIIVMYCSNNCDGSKDCLANYDPENYAEKHLEYIRKLNAKHKEKK